MLNGVLNVYKEAGMTSFQVVSNIRKITGEKKAGHTGTLDPDAMGVLAVCLGKATKLVDHLMDTDKQYRARLRFGTKTDTLDISGTVLEEMSSDKIRERLRGIDFEKLLEDRFTGMIYQVPPMYSALKVNGVKLVDAARKGLNIDRQPRPVTIYGYSDVSLVSRDDGSYADLLVDCSKGTYIRTLCEDIGKALDIPACMERLERTKTSMLTINDSYTISEIGALFNAGRGGEILIPPDRFLERYPAGIIKNENVIKVMHGNILDKNNLTLDNNESYDDIIRVYDENGRFYALYRHDPGKNCYLCEKMFTDENDN